MKNKRYILLLLALLTLPGVHLSAQNLEEGTNEIEHTGTEVQVDSTLLGRDIFSVLPEGVVVRQSSAVRTRATTDSASACISTAAGPPAKSPPR